MIKLPWSKDLIVVKQPSLVFHQAGESSLFFSSFSDIVRMPDKKDFVPV